MDATSTTQVPTTTPQVQTTKATTSIPLVEVNNNDLVASTTIRSISSTLPPLTTTLRSNPTTKITTQTESNTVPTQLDSTKTPNQLTEEQKDLKAQFEKDQESILLLQNAEKTKFTTDRSNLAYRIIAEAVERDRGKKEIQNKNVFTTPRDISSQITTTITNPTFSNRFLGNMDTASTTQVPTTTNFIESTTISRRRTTTVPTIRTTTRPRTTTRAPITTTILTTLTESITTPATQTTSPISSTKQPRQLTEQQKKDLATLVQLEKEQETLLKELAQLTSLVSFYIYFYMSLKQL